MPTYFFTYLLLLIGSTVVTFSASLIARKRNAPGSTTLRALLVVMSMWSATAAAIYIQDGFAGKVFWLNVMVVPVAIAPILFMTFILKFSGSPVWVTRRALTLLYAFSIVFILLQWTNSYHHLVLSSVQLVEQDGFSALKIQRGPVYFVNLAIAYGTVTMGILTLVREALRASHLYRNQYRLLLLGCIVPLAFSIYSQLDYNALGNLDTSPISFGITGVIFAFTTLRTHFMDLIPVARSHLIENMGDGVLVLDAQNRIADLNPAMEVLLAEQPQQLLGKCAFETFGGWVEKTSAIFGDFELKTEVRLPSMPSQILDLRMTPLYDKNDLINGRLLVFRDITERKEVEKRLRDANFRLKSQLIEIGILQSQLREQAVRDSLTGLFNRRYLEETLDRELARAARESYPVSIIMIDIDHFKQINDTYGHEAGDIMLKALGGMLMTHSRRGDFACRYGGEEFLIVMPNMARSIVQERAAALRQSLKALMVRYGNHTLTATYSMGIASYPANGDTRESFLRAADMAMYAAKNAGRDDIRSFDEIEALVK
ncbi:MAG: diguanylate cyclase [Anaerolineae bacterium]|nr:diguanylate cyclase [Anaerolineae bacterium]MBL8106322.1 diguanylate cyclase [Anaerolineales bacterium]MCC7187769.1 diguanylate cyclase [Anaerolineales bacterium]